jgi:hypothetical protein
VIEKNQGVTASASQSIETTGKTRHVLNMNISNCEDIRLALDHSTGNATNPVKIRKVLIKGHYII